jgi:chromosome segregation ATPase
LPKAGIIERVCFKNFKCHSYLEFKLHPYINFILGRNGSKFKLNFQVNKYFKIQKNWIVELFVKGGKSAVMDAIILGLGGKAQSTGRQASAKTFIKTNSE